MTDEGVSADRRGRPRSEGARRAILHAAYELLQETGFRQVTIEGVARRAGVGKSTIYRWWKNKSVLLLEAVNSMEESYPEFQETGDTRATLVLEVQGVIDYFAVGAGRAFLDLVAESRFDRSLAEVLSRQFVAARRDATRQVIECGRRHGELSVDRVDLEALMDMVWGAIYYRFLVLHEVPDGGYATRLVEHAWRLLAVEAGGD